MTRLEKKRSIASAWESRRENLRMRPWIAVLAIILSVAAGLATVNGITEQDSRIIVMTTRDSLNLHWTTNWSPDIWISSPNAKDVIMNKVNSTDSSIRFSKEGEYYLTVGFAGGTPGAEITLKKIGIDKAEVLASYIVAGSASFTLKLKAIVQGPSVVEWQGLLPSLQYFQWVPLTLKRPIKLLIFFAPLMYFGGYAFLELSDKGKELKQKGMVQASLKNTIFRVVKYVAVIGFVLFWVFIVFFL